MTFTLTSETAKGIPLTATFDPDHGMNLLSYRWGEIEVIAQSTRPLFDERCAGLGALIGPHFHHRPQLKTEPYSHGIARYVPWHCETTEAGFKAELSGKAEWKGSTLAEIEGQDFTMWYKGNLTPEGLKLELSISSETDSVVGFHTYYSLPGGTGRVRSRVEKEYHSASGADPIPTDWQMDDQQRLELPLDRPYDIGFFPYPDPLKGKIELETATHTLEVSYSCPNEWNSWQLWHPEGADFVCIEPLSAKDPRKPHLSVSSVGLHIALTDHVASK